MWPHLEFVLCTSGITIQRRRNTLTKHSSPNRSVLFVWLVSRCWYSGADSTGWVHVPTTHCISWKLLIKNVKYLLKCQYLNLSCCVQLLQPTPSVVCYLVLRVLRPCEGGIERTTRTQCCSQVQSCNGVHNIQQTVHSLCNSKYQIFLYSIHKKAFSQHAEPTIRQFSIAIN